MDNITLTIGLGLGFLVLMIRKNPALLTRGLDHVNELPATHNRLLALMAFAAWLIVWSVDAPRIFGFLSSEPWIIVPLAYAAWYVAHKGAKWMITKFLIALLVTSILKIGGSEYAACWGRLDPTSRCVLPDGLVWTFKSDHHQPQVRQAGGALGASETEAAMPKNRYVRIPVTNRGSQAVSIPVGYNIIAVPATNIEYDATIRMTNGTHQTKTVHVPRSGGGDHVRIKESFDQMQWRVSTADTVWFNVCVHQPDITCGKP